MVFLLQFQLDGFSFRNSLVVFAVLARKPGLELFVLTIKAFQGFADDIGWVCIEELCIPVQIESDFFLQADLEGGSLRLF